MPTLHVYLDESGDFNFTPKGSRYYVFAAAWTYDPAPLALALTNLRFSLLKRGYNIQAFHAFRDKQAHRNSVIETITRHDNWRFAAIVVEKAKLNPVIRDPYRFYPKFASMVLRFVFRGYREPGTDNVLIFTDALPINKHRESVEKSIKLTCRFDLGTSIRFASYHHQRASNAWIQVADYCSWAVNRKWNGDPRTYDSLLPRLVREELDVFAAGTNFYY